MMRMLSIYRLPGVAADSHKVETGEKDMLACSKQRLRPTPVSWCSLPCLLSGVSVALVMRACSLPSYCVTQPLPLNLLPHSLHANRTLARVITTWRRHIILTHRQQVHQYNFNNPGFSHGTGHFTQMVWVSSTQLGCAAATGCGTTYYTCHYSPAGNIASAQHFRDNVLPATGGY